MNFSTWKHPRFVYSYRVAIASAHMTQYRGRWLSAFNTIVYWPTEREADR